MIAFARVVKKVFKKVGDFLFKPTSDKMYYVNLKPLLSRSGEQSLFLMVIPLQMVLKVLKRHIIALTHKAFQKAFFSPYFSRKIQKGVIYG